MSSSSSCLGEIFGSSETNGFKFGGEFSYETSPLNGDNLPIDPFSTESSAFSEENDVKNNNSEGLEEPSKKKRKITKGTVSIISKDGSEFEFHNHMIIKKSSYLKALLELSKETVIKTDEDDFAIGAIHDYLYDQKITPDTNDNKILLLVFKWNIEILEIKYLNRLFAKISDETSRLELVNIFKNLPIHIITSSKSYLSPFIQNFVKLKSPGEFTHYIKSDVLRWSLEAILLNHILMPKRS